MVRVLALVVALVLAPPTTAAAKCTGDCASRIGIVSAFGAEADLLVAETRSRRTRTIAGQRFTTGVLRGNRVVIVLSGVSMVNAALTTQRLVDHFRIERLVLSGIAGGVDPARRVGDVVAPESWAMPMEVYWSRDDALPAPCGGPGELACLGLRLAHPDGSAPSSYRGLFVRENQVTSAQGGAAAEFVFDYRADPSMLAVARSIAPPLDRCGSKAGNAGVVDPKLCVATLPELVVGGRGVSGTAFVADAAYGEYLAQQLHAQCVDMETAALAHVARANGVPFIAFRSLSDLAGAEGFNADVAALFSSGLAERNAAAVTLAFLAAWHERAGPSMRSR
ncbi:MAG: 5'-methylthioadenosine/S-adenosylhomocysteine nucleosidase [Rhizobacter sp.]|nr:5'-methylthioadenosine/S-adenosylhomocysteine nucleosidase [Rhizobacter sp.]